MATSREIKEKAIQSLIDIISDCVKRSGGKITTRVNIGEARIHNDVFIRKIRDVFDYKHSNKDALRNSEHDLYYSEDCCHDAPIEELDFNSLYELACRCENINN